MNICIRILTLIGGFFFTYSQVSDGTCDCAKDIFQQMWRLHPIGEAQLWSIIDEQLPPKISNLPHYPTREEINMFLYHSEESPYMYVSEISEIEDDEYVTYAQKLAPYLKEYVLEKLGRPPKLIVEVGAYVGSGAIFAWAPIVQHNDNDGVIICIDTWQGDVNMRVGEHFVDIMNAENGHPQLYEKFLRRVMSRNLQDTIYPFPISSIVGARVLALTHWIVDFIYIDSAHEVGETFAELVIYFQLLRQGGILMGDDYVVFPAVKHDVDLFVKYFHTEITFELLMVEGYPNEWVITKL